MGIVVTVTLGPILRIPDFEITGDTPFSDRLYDSGILKNSFFHLPAGTTEMGRKTKEHIFIFALCLGQNLTVRGPVLE